MITESSQLISTVLRLRDHAVIEDPSVMKKSHVHHPNVKWLEDTFYGFVWLCIHTEELIAIYDEHTEPKNRKHQRARRLLDVCNNCGDLDTPKEFVPPYLAFGTDTKTEFGKVLNAKYKALQAQSGIWNETRGVWVAPDFDKAVSAYQTYYRLKIFKNGVLPTFEKNGIPDWYQHVDICALEQK